MNTLTMKEIHETIFFRVLLVKQLMIQLAKIKFVIDDKPMIVEQIKRFSVEPAGKLWVRMIFQGY